jgi:membrane protein
VADGDAGAQLEEFIEDYVPGIADELALQQVRASAASLQVFGALALLVTGLAWVDATRASVRSPGEFCSPPPWSGEWLWSWRRDC